MYRNHFYIICCRYDSLVLVLLYGLYIVLMVFNKKLEAFFIDKFDSWFQRCGSHHGSGEDRQSLLGSGSGRSFYDESAKSENRLSNSKNFNRSGEKYGEPKEVETSFSRRQDSDMEKSANHKDCKQK